MSPEVPFFRRMRQRHVQAELARYREQLGKPRPSRRDPIAPIRRYVADLCGRFLQNFPEYRHIGSTATSPRAGRSTCSGSAREVSSQADVRPVATSPSPGRSPRPGSARKASPKADVGPVAGPLAFQDDFGNRIVFRVHLDPGPRQEAIQVACDLTVRGILVSGTALKLPRTCLDLNRVYGFVEGRFARLVHTVQAI